MMQTCFNFFLCDSGHRHDREKKSIHGQTKKKRKNTKIHS